MIVLIENNNNKRKNSWTKEKDFQLIGAVQTSENGCAGVVTIGGMLVAISIHTQASTCTNNSDSGDSWPGEEWVLVAPMSRGV